MENLEIKSIKAREVLDSRGNPTVEVDLVSSSGHLGRAAVPSGASTGSREALELRDGGSRYLGKGVEKAVQNINQKIAPALAGKNLKDQKALDHAMLEMDGTENKENLGANAILAVSLAAARAGAASLNLSLFKYLREELGCPSKEANYKLPAPLMNIINGGEHASNNLSIQEFMIIPRKFETFKENLRVGTEVFHHLKKVLTDSKHSTNVGDEGGFAPDFKSHDEALETIAKAIDRAGYVPAQDISFALDAAASEFYKDGTYTFCTGESFSPSGLVDYYVDLKERFPIASIEDGLHESDYAGWQEITQKMGETVKIVGDDLFVTNQSILKEGIEKNWANTILIKLNQIGSLTETFDTLKLAFDNGIDAIISHRSGETADSFIADLAVASSSGYIKTGSASRSDRLAKYNQLLRIEEELLGN